MTLNNPVDIANQIAAAAAPLVVAPAVAPAVAAPAAAVVAPAVAIVGVTPTVAPVVDTGAILAGAAASGLTVVGADPLAVAPVAGTATETAGSTATPATAPVLAPPLTRAEQIQKSIDANIAKRDAAIAAIEKLTVQLGSIDKLDSIVSGSIIIVQLGRAETLRQVQGTVTGIKADESGSKKFKVLVGEGFDATTEVVNESQVIEVK